MAFVLLNKRHVMLCYVMLYRFSRDCPLEDFHRLHTADDTVRETGWRHTTDNNVHSECVRYM